ncbi:MAG: hypothetical protein HOM63_03305 [Kordiimonadaceae bacterium]|nr:hypothetical protein [Kordiimonadaceae bacterium]
MIIHRLANAIRHQNWSQIITEILIVVIGIFLGLQVQGWYDDRSNRAQEHIYLSRLHQEVENLITATSFNLEFTKKRNERLFHLGNYVTGKIDPYEFDVEDCRSIVMSSAFFNTAVALASYGGNYRCGERYILGTQKHDCLG